jgi:hypothetical protein
MPLRKNQRHVRLGQIEPNLWVLAVGFDDCREKMSCNLSPIMQPFLDRLDTYAEVGDCPRNVAAFGLYRGDPLPLFGVAEDGDQETGIGALFPEDGSVVTNEFDDDHPWLRIFGAGSFKWRLSRQVLPNRPLELRDITREVDWLAAMIRPRAMVMKQAEELNSAKLAIGWCKSEYMMRGFELLAAEACLAGDVNI